MATVTKRGKYWRAQICRLGFPPQHKSSDTHAEAEAWARAAESEMDRGIFVARAESEPTTLAEALARYKTAISSCKAHPAQDYQRISHWLLQPLAHRYLANLKGPDFAPYWTCAERSAELKTPSASNWRSCRICSKSRGGSGAFLVIV